MIAEALTKIRNASTAGKRSLKVPYSKLNFEVVQALVKAGYVESAERKGRGVKKIIDIELKQSDGKPAIEGVRVVSRPSRRVYMGYRDVRTSRQGFGSFILSTPHGIMDGRSARKQKVGGELLFEIW
ncbi:MAG: 30S ribosomal protein S8 [Candidatus Colwellbacteria bacterium]|nr:30S ribosomal protein S8 [Candidatus Colwellbacteria bacterium]